MASRTPLGGSSRSPSYPTNPYPMPTATKDISEQEVATRLKGKSGPEAAAELRKLASEASGVTLVEKDESVSVNLAPGDFDRLFSGILSETKKVVEETATKIEHKYDFTAGHAHAEAEAFLGKELASQHRKNEENKIIGKRFATIMKAQMGMFSGDDHKRACEEEADYLRKAGVDSRIGQQLNSTTAAMSLGTDTTGGFLAPELWETRVYQALLKTSYARRFGTLLDMTGREILRMPRMTGGLTAYTRDEATAGTTSQPTFTQFTLQPKTLMVTSNPISIELIEAGVPAVIELLTQDAVRAFGRKEDECVFVGSDSQFTGLLESSTNVVTMANGKTSAVDATFEDLFDMETQLGEQYTPDADNENSGGAGSQAMYFFNKAVLNALRKLKGNDNYYWSPVTEMLKERTVAGYPIKRVADMPNTAATTSTKFGAFGDLSYVYIGYRPGIRTDLLKEGTVSGANLGTTAQYALRFIEFFDQSLIDTSAFSILSTSAS
jgi:HK97 family phage major capsid protein